MSACAINLTETFNATNPKSVEWIKRNAARLITDLESSARAAVRVAVSEGYAQNMTAEQIAKRIRSVIGLTERDAQAVMRKQLTLMEKGATPAKAQAAADRYAAKLTRARATLIAEHESHTAAVEGQRLLWDQAIDTDMLDANLRKVWITADPCPICAPMEGVTVGIRESFPNGPPAHIKCKCTEGLVAA